MATHVGCPICGKSSAMKSFPSGPGNEVVLETFRSLGWRRGFKVVDRSSGLDDAVLCRGIVPKVLSLVAALVKHGHLTPGEVEKAVGKPLASGELQRASRAARQWKQRADALDRTLQTERGYAEREVERLERERGESKADRDRLARVAREHVASMRRILEDLEEALVVDDTLSEVYSRLKARTDAFEEAITSERPE